MRGAFACPTIATLAELGLTQRMLAGPFKTTDFDGITNTEALDAVFNYLEAVGVVKAQDDGSFQTTEEGNTVLKRAGAFLLIHSYRDYFIRLGDLLQTGRGDIEVDRRHNVLGSGSLHSRKFFPAVWHIFQSLKPKALIDIGCGDGHFLNHAATEHPGLAIAGVDLSSVAVETTLARLKDNGHSEVVGVVDSGEEIERWIEKMPLAIRNGRPLVLSMWFIAHEFSGGDVARVVRFFERVHRTVPTSHFILGEIVRIEPQVLYKAKDQTIMPEFLLFHELSGQGVLSWSQWQEVLNKIPFDLLYEKRFDEVGEGISAIPSSFVWHLQPRLHTLEDIIHVQIASK